MNTIHAIYENGVFRPTVPVNLPELTSVEVLLPAAAGRGAPELEPLQRAREMIAQGAEDLDADDAVDAKEVFAEMAARRVRLQAERLPRP